MRKAITAALALLVIVAVEWPWPAQAADTVLIGMVSGTGPYDGRYETGLHDNGAYNWFVEVPVAMLDNPIPAQAHWSTKVEITYAEVEEFDPSTLEFDENGELLPGQEADALTSTPEITCVDIPRLLKEYVPSHLLNISVDGTKCMFLISATEQRGIRPTKNTVGNLALWEYYLINFGYPHTTWLTASEWRTKLNSSDYKPASD